MLAVRAVVFDREGGVYVRVVEVVSVTHCRSWSLRNCLCLTVPVRVRYPLLKVWEVPVRILVRLLRMAVLPVVRSVVVGRAVAVLNRRDLVVDDQSALLVAVLPQ